MYSKLKNFTYDNFRMQSYLSDPNISVKQAKLIFKFRTRMLMEFSDNFRGGPEKKLCKLCDYKHTDSQEMIIHCTKVHAKFGDPGKLNKI